MSIYSAPYFEHFINPRNLGEQADADAVGSAGGLGDCGDVIKIYLKFDGRRLSKVTFQAAGCPAAVASGSAVAEAASGLTLDEAAKINNNLVDKILGGLPAAKKRCSNLGAQALQAALENLISRDDFTTSIRVDKLKVAVAMSGGVDSSTTAALLLERGYKVIGLTMRLHDADGGESTKSCCSPRDISDARTVADDLGIPHFTVDLRQRFKTAVIDKFCLSYLAGRTPNPCVACNREIKFKDLAAISLKLGAGSLATGHYVKIGFDQNRERYLVRRAADARKDQSYMFWDADQKVLEKLIMPLGDTNKQSIREQARRFKLQVAAKPESQEICFIPDHDYHRFLKEYAGYTPVPGPIVDQEGRRLGTHSGLAFYTVGQRRGLGVSHSEPLYVTAVDTGKNTLIVGVKSQIKQRLITAGEVNFIPFDQLPRPLHILAKYRYNMAPTPALVEPLAGSRVKVTFDRPQAGLAAGQSVVFYDDDLVVGGGVIE